MNDRWIYIDFNSYFASVEQQVDVRLRGKPVAVIAVDTDATSAIAASYEAKAFGVKTGTPIWEAKKMCPGLICVLAKHELYIEFHEKILQEVDRHVPISKVCSIDEVAAELMDNEREDVIGLALKIKEGIRKNVGECIRCSIGIAPNCYLAKVATDMQKPDGLVFIREEDLPKKLYSLELRDLPGIGANMEVRLKSRGIGNMKTLCSLDLHAMRKAWGSTEGERMWHHLRGIPLPDRKTERKSLGHSQVLAPELRDREKAREAGRRLTAKAASRLRRMELVASKISLSIAIKDGEFLECSMNCDRVEDTLTFLSLFQKMWSQTIPKGGSFQIRKVAVTFSKLEPSKSEQYDLFQDSSSEKKKKISHVLDKINQKYGKDSLSLGPVLTDSGSGTKIAFKRIPDREEFFE